MECNIYNQTYQMQIKRCSYKTQKKSAAKTQRTAHLITSSTASKTKKKIEEMRTSRRLILRCRLTMAWQQRQIVTHRRKKRITIS